MPTGAKLDPPGIFYGVGTELGPVWDLEVGGGDDLAEMDTTSTWLISAGSQDGEGAQAGEEGGINTHIRWESLA